MNNNILQNNVQWWGGFSYLNIPVLTCLYDEIVKYRWDKFIPSFCVGIK